MAITIKDIEGKKVGDKISNFAVNFRKNKEGKIRVTYEVITDEKEIVEIDDKTYVFAQINTSRSEGIKKCITYFDKDLVDRCPKRFTMFDAGPYKRLRVKMGVEWGGEKNIYISNREDDYTEEEEKVVGVDLSKLTPEPVPTVKKTPSAPKAAGVAPVKMPPVATDASGKFNIPPAKLPTSK